MEYTAYPQVKIVLKELATRLASILGEKLVGLYVGGSLVNGDFDSEVSDIDLTAIILDDLNLDEFSALKKMHQDLPEEFEKWNDRIEMRYVTLDAIKHVKSYTGNVAHICPGEPFHTTEIRKHWLTDWYTLQEKGRVIKGPEPRTVIEPITKEEFVNSVKENVQGWKEWVKDMKNQYAQSYAILTLCRAYYVFANCEQPSKKQAAFWTAQQLPEWLDLINQALVWRKEEASKKTISEKTYIETEKFVNYILNLIQE